MHYLQQRTVIHRWEINATGVPHEYFRSFGEQLFIDWETGITGYPHDQGRAIRHAGNLGRYSQTLRLL